MDNAYHRPQQEPMPTMKFLSVAGVGAIWAVQERYSDGWFGVSWASTSLARVRSMETAAYIARAVAESGADNIHDMRALVASLLPEKAQ